MSTHVRSPKLPSSAACARCPEYHDSALGWGMWRGARAVLCRVCRRELDDEAHGRPTTRRVCAVCRRLAPCEAHHIGYQAHYPHLLITLCLNCHAIITTRQASQWRKGASGVYYLVQGCYDLIYLWWERSPLVDELRDMLTALGHAALALLSALLTNPYQTLAQASLLVRFDQN